MGSFGGGSPASSDPVPPAARRKGGVRFVYSTFFAIWGGPVRRNPGERRNVTRPSGREAGAVSGLGLTITTVARKRPARASRETVATTKEPAERPPLPTSVSRGA